MNSAAATSKRPSSHQTPPTFDSIYQEHVKVVRSILNQFKLSEEDCEDLIQETFIRFFENQSEIRPERTRAFLVTVARNLALDAYRKKVSRRTEAVEDFADVMEQNHAQITSARHFIVHQYLQDIKQRSDAQAVVLFYEEQLSVKDIAARYDQSTSTVCSTLCRQRRKIKRDLELRLESSIYLEAIGGG